MCELETPEIVQARLKISDFVIAEATERKRVLGFGWTVSPSGPASYPQLQEAYFRSALTREPLPLHSSLLNNLSGLAQAAPADTINAAHAALFWHDTNHVRLGLDFSPGDEATLGRWQLMRMHMAGFRPSSMECQVMAADTLGQIECGRQLGRYPRDPLRFTALTIREGFARALEIERRQ